MLCASRIVGMAQLLFESGDYFVQHFRRCGHYLRAASDRANTVGSFIALINNYCWLTNDKLSGL